MEQSILVWALHFMACFLVAGTSNGSTTAFLSGPRSFLTRLVVEKYLGLSFAETV